MSKGRVWNKGKRNGGGGPPEGSKSWRTTAQETGNHESKTQSNSASSISGGPANPINLIKPMNRTNWVERQTRVSRPAEQDDPNNSMK